MSLKRKPNDGIPSQVVKREKNWQPEINSSLFDAQTLTDLKSAWRGNTSYKNGNIELHCNPFPHCVISQFLNTDNYVVSLEKELLQLKFRPKSNDLFKFKQSNDLKNQTDPCVTELKSLLFGHFRSWLSELMDVELEPTVDISCAKYQHTDVLLCHDDELEGRRVAFILYLVPPWQPGDGGTLDLFSTDEQGQPLNVVKSLVPTWNTLVFFEVSPVSFHQVSEVLSSEKCRLSLSGWFHGSSLPRPAPYTEAPAPRLGYLPCEEGMLQRWINHDYLNLKYQVQARREFQANSEIRLLNFLQKERFVEVTTALRSTEIKWMLKGPANRRNYEFAEISSLPPCLQECWKLFSSEAFFILLSNTCGLKLHEMAPDNSSDEEEDEEDDNDDSDDDSNSEDDNDDDNHIYELELQQGAADMTSDDEHNPPFIVPNKCMDSSVDGNANKDTEKDLESLAGTSNDVGKSRKASKTSPGFVGELRRWRHGHYTLLHDAENSREFALDLLLTLGCPDWQPEFGGFTSYIAHGEDEELLTVNPEDNSLALVYRDPETVKFVKYVNSSSSSLNEKDKTSETFFDLSFVYFE